MLIGGTLHGKDSVVAWGLGRYTPEASAGIPMVMLNSLNFRFSSDPGHLSVIEGLRQLILILALSP